MALDLMPISTEAPRCSEFARSIDLLPPGSGLFLERVVLVSVPLPWPKPALNHDRLRSLGPVLGGGPARTRLFAMEPTNTDATGITVEVYDRVGSSTTARQWQVAQPGDLAPLIIAVASCEAGQLDSIASGFNGAPIEVIPTFLVCTQGSHDLCCGTSGVALADQIQAERPDYALRRVSHTGGHRFSPTFLALPTGRMWAFADLDLVDRVASNQLESADFVQYARGWWGAKVGPEQVAECAVRAERPDLVDLVARIESVDTAVPTPSEFHVSVGDHAWRVEVHVERDVPSISCEAPGGLPAKPGREFGWTIAPR